MSVLFAIALLVVFLSPVALLVVSLSLRARIDRLARESRLRREETNRTIAALERRLSELEPTAGDAPAPSPEPVAPPPPARAPESTPATETVRPLAAARPQPSPSIGSLSPPTPATPAAARVKAEPPPPSRTAEDIEALIGGSWLNRIGVLVLVIALALLVGYSFNYLGPAGRVGIGMAVSMVLLGSGLAFERRERYQLYGRGLVGGGWAGLYFTTYAMHGVDAARVIDSQVAGSTVLLAVAVAMILHSLRYGSEVATGLAFIVGFATLAISPMTTFALLATVPLAALLLLVGRQRGWVRLALVGVVVTYSVYLFSNGQLPVTGSPFGDFVAGQATLVIYWLMFELFDLAGRWLKRPSAAPDLEAAVFPLNAVAFVGVSTLQWMATDASQLDRFLPLAALLFLLSSIVRARLDPLELSSRSSALRGYEAAMTVSAALGVLAILQRFTGYTQTSALLLEGQLLFVAGIRLRQPFLRWLAAPILLLAWVDLNQRHFAFDDVAVRAELSAWSLVGAVTAALLYGNRLWVRMSQRAGTLPIDRLYSFAATVTVAMTVRLEAPSRMVEIGWLVLALLLLEAGIRLNLTELRIQAYSVAALAFLFVFGSRVAPLGIPSMELWVALGGSTVLTWAVALRLQLAAGQIADEERRLARNIFFPAATLLLLGFIRQLLPAALVAPAWMAVGLLMVEIGATSATASLRALGHAVALAAFVRLYTVNLFISGETAGWSDTTLTIVPMVVAAYWLAARGLSLRSAVATSDLDMAVVRAWLWLPVPALMALTMREVDVLWIAPLWAAYALVLLLVGRRRGIGDLRLQGYLLIAPVVVVALATLIFEEGTAAGRIAAIGITAAVMYGVRIAVQRRLVPLDSPGKSGDLDDRATNLHSLVATGLISSLLVAEVSGALLTVALAVQGAAVMVAGFALADRVMRLMGLTLLGLVVVKAFAYDLRNLTAVYRILSFAVLGMLLLSVSFIYTKYRERLKKLL